MTEDDLALRPPLLLGLVYGLVFSGSFCWICLLPAGGAQRGFALLLWGLGLVLAWRQLHHMRLLRGLRLGRDGLQLVYAGHRQEVDVLRVWMPVAALVTLRCRPRGRRWPSIELVIPGPAMRDEDHHRLRCYLNTLAPQAGGIKSPGDGQ